jgi:hypothetical protein
VIVYLTDVNMISVSKFIPTEIQFITNMIKFRICTSLFHTVFVHSQWHKFLGGQSEVGIWLPHHLRMKHLSVESEFWFMVAALTFGFHPRLHSSE